ncbi:hypothetical protein Tco_1369833 [Tanacetum coccineum]
MLSYSPGEYNVSTFHCQYSVIHSNSQYGVFSQLNTAYRLSDIAADSNLSYLIFCMTRSLNKDLVQPFENPELVFRSSRKLSKTLSLDYLSSLKFNLISDPEDLFKEEETETMREPTMEEYMTKTPEGYGSSIARPKIKEKDHFELKGQFLKELRDKHF